MNTLFSQRYRFGWKYHLVIVGVALLFFLAYWYGVVRGAHPSHRADLWILAAIGAGVFYANFLLIWPVTIVHYQVRWRRVVGLFLANFVAVIGLLVFLSMAFGNLTVDLSDFRPADLYTLVNGSIRNFAPYMIPMFCCISASLIAFLVEWIYLPFANRKDTDRAIQTARLAWRRAQLDPHLLDTYFVMLSVITRESQTKAQIALDYTIKVIHFYIGGNKPEALIRLDAEIQCIGYLIEIQRIRFGSSLNWLLSVEIDTGEIETIPMILMPLGENMVRYAVLNSATHPAVMRVRLADGNLFVSTENRIRVANGQQGSGTGMANLEERLAFFYPGRYRLSSASEDGWYRTELEIYGLAELQTACK